nr:MAG TPA: hypothetical protein [Caudoviricetes sp.]DAS04496.1 MAG TPA: hypothetical protein [Caudoviricetes sp.]
MRPKYENNRIKRGINPLNTTKYYWIFALRLIFFEKKYHNINTSLIFRYFCQQSKCLKIYFQTLFMLIFI